MSKPTSQTKKPFDYRKVYLVLLYVIYSGWGILQVFSYALVFEYLFALMMATAATFWTVTDASLRSKPIPHILQIVTLIFWPVAVPIYLIRSRGWRGLGWALLHAFGLLVTWFVSFYAAYVTLYNIQLLEN